MKLALDLRYSPDTIRLRTRICSRCGGEFQGSKYSKVCDACNLKLNRIPRGRRKR